MSAASDVPADANRTGAQAVDRALALLTCFADGSDSVTLTQLAGRTGLRLSTAHRLLRALVRGGLVEQDPMTERYRLGRMTAILGQQAMVSFGFATARADLLLLAEQTGESAGLGLREGGDVVMVLHAESEQPLRFDEPVGTRIRLHASAMGKAILAFSGLDAKATVAALDDLPRYTAHTLTRRAALTAELQRVQEHGFAVNREERYPGVCGVAAPVLDARGRARAAVGIRGPAVRFDAREEARLGALVVATADVVAGHLPLDRL